MAQRAAEHSLRDLNQLNRIAVGMLSVHRKVSNALEEASNGRMDEAKAYAVHTQLVDELAAMAPLETWLANEPAEHTEWRQSESQLAFSSFEAYRNHVSMATDIVAIDPSKARGYVHSAFDHYLAFASSHQKLTAQISTRNSALLDKLTQERQAHFDNAWWATLVGLAGLNLVWLVVVGWLTRNLAHLTAAMRHLSGPVSYTHLDVYKRQAKRRQARRLMG